MYVVVVSSLFITKANDRFFDGTANPILPPAPKIDQILFCQIIIYK